MTAAHGQPIEPVAGMGEMKAEMRKQEAKVTELKKEVERLVRNDSIRNDADVHSRGNVVDSEVINVEATFYTAFCPTGCTGITATGLDVSSTIYTPEGLRVIAVDPSVIALDSTVQVTLANGETFKAKASDTGGAIRGNKIDVLVSDRATAYSLGRQSATVEVLSK